MTNESLTQIRRKTIYTQFTCPDCCGHRLGAKVECDADITSFDDKDASFILSDKQEQEFTIALFCCRDCSWNTDEESDVMDYMK